MKFILVTGTSMAQAQGKEHGKTSAKYKEAAAICELAEEDMAKLNVKPGDPVRVKSAYGSVVVRAVKAREPTPGVAFIPSGPWANAVTSPETGGSGIPSYKSLEVEIEPAPGEQILDLPDLLRQTVGVKR
ncbi:MAG: molybdopterin dinucleotide binding domain-containing protein [Candidatus Hecatellaceae archaeon]